MFLQSTDAGPVVHFSCTTGGRAGRGEIYELHVGAGRLVRRYEVSGAGPIDMPDNLWVLPSGHVIVATFGPEGPTQCSGLDVSRYDAGALHDEFGARFRLVEHAQEIHRTPWGAAQQFVYCLCVLGD